MRRGLTSILCICLSLGLPTAASAQPSDPSAIQRGKEKFDAGQEALRQGDTGKALALFKESLDLNVTTGALLNVAYCEEKLGLLASAEKHYRAALGLLPDDASDAVIAKERLTAIVPRVPTLRIRLDKAAPPATAVFLGERELPAYALDTDMRLDPGAYQIIVKAPGHSPRIYDVALEEGEKETIAVFPISTAPTTSVTPQSIPPLPGSPASPLRIAGFVGFGVAGAAVIAGAITGGMALARREELGKGCPTMQDCPIALQPLQVEGKVFGDSSTVMFTIAAAAAAGGTGLLLVGSRPSNPKPEVGLSIGAGAISIRGRF